MFRKNPSPVGQAIVDSLEAHPEKWNVDDNYLFIGAVSSYKAPVRIWITSGTSNVRLAEPMITKLQPRDKKPIWRAFERWQVTQGNVGRFLEILKEAEAA